MSGSEREWLTLYVTGGDGTTAAFGRTQQMATAQAWEASYRRVRPHLEYRIGRLYDPVRADLVAVFGPTTEAEQEQINAAALQAWEESRQVGA